MRKKTINCWNLLVLALLISAFLCGSMSYGQGLPQPGETIDKSNYKKYSHLFPPEFLSAFEDGFGLIKPVHMKVAATEPIPIPKEYIKLSAKNKGKYGLDAKGNITGGYNREGLPFPDLQESDKDFTTKLMWNFDSRYSCDVQHDTGGGIVQKRKGENLTWTGGDMTLVSFKNRLVVSPKPDLLPNPMGVYKVQFIHQLYPESQKNTIFGTYRYVDLNKSDDTYLYLPSLRRVIRAEAAQRSVPFSGTIQAQDDTNCFDGRIPEFTYTLVGEQKIIALTESKLSGSPRDWKTELPFCYEGYEVRDTYVIDIKPKDPKYPQGRKRIWLDKENGSNIYYAVAWDRAGKPWKVFMNLLTSVNLFGARHIIYNGTFAVDLQFGIIDSMVEHFKINKGNFTFDDVSPSRMLKLGR